MGTTDYNVKIERNVNTNYWRNKLIAYDPAYAADTTYLYGDKAEYEYKRLASNGSVPDFNVQLPTLATKSDVSALDAKWVAGLNDPNEYLDSVTLLTSFPVRENGEVSWPQGFSINKAADEIYVSNQNGTELRIDIRTLSTGVRKSSRIITTQDQAWSEGLPYFYNGSNQLCFIVRYNGGTPAQSAYYSIYNYTTGTLGASIAILGGVKSDVEGPYFVTSDVWTRSVTNFYIYDWASVKAGTPTLLATIPVEGGVATSAKNQGLAYVGGNFFLGQGDQSESPTFMSWDSQGKLRTSRQFSKAAFKDLVNKLRPGTLTIDNYIYESEGCCNLDGKFISGQIVNDTPAVTANGIVLIIQHNSPSGTKGLMQPVTSYKYDTGWIPLVLQNGFTAAYGPTPAIRRIGNSVECRGNIANATATGYVVAATIPTDPGLELLIKKTEVFPCTSNTTAVLGHRVNDVGASIESYSSVATGAWRSLSGIRYRTD